MDMAQPQANPYICTNIQRFMEFGINWKDIFTISMILFAVIDIVGSIPIIVDLRSKMGHIQSEKATIVAAVIMIAFLFVGEEILKLIGIDANSFAVAGSFVLFFLALEMILGIRLYKEDNPSTASIGPLMRKSASSTEFPSSRALSTTMTRR